MPSMLKVNPSSAIIESSLNQSKLSNCRAKFQLAFLVISAMASKHHQYSDYRMKLTESRHSRQAG